MAEKTVFLFTKKFPFGHQETYLFNELPYLTKEFNKVIIVPYDEFEYLPEHNRIKEEANLEILRINKIHNTLSFSQKMTREKTALQIMLFEVLKGREPGNHFKYRKRNLSQLRHSYTNAISLKAFILKNSLHDIVLYNYWLHGGIVISGMLNKMLDHKYPVVSRAHAYDVYHKDWYSIYPASHYLFLGFETWKVHHTDRIYPISTHAYNHFARLFPKLRSKFEIARLGVLEQKKSATAGISTTLTLVSCSNIDENKRIYRIPEILSLINKKVQWFHFGKGKQEDVEKVEKEILHHNLKDSCTLMGFTPNAEVINFYKTHSIDLFINLSQIEGIPVSLMEAASFGIPMLATKTVGNPEIVTEENGFLVDINFDVKQTANRLNAYFGDENAIAKKREASHQTFLQKYNASVNYPEFINKIKTVTYASN